MIATSAQPSFRARIAALVDSHRFEQAIIALIAINAVTLGLETNDSVVAAIGPVLAVLDRIILAIFVVELILRFVARPADFVRDPWRIFDFVVVGIALLPATGALSVLRAFRILRILRLVGAVPSMRRVVAGLLLALPGMGSIALLLGLIFYVFSVMATNLYGDDFPELFGSIAASAYSLFQIMTLEGWSAEIVRPVMALHPLAWAFFLPFIVATTFAVLNLFVGVIVDAMQSQHQAEEDASRAEMMNESEVMLVEIRAMRAELAELRTVVAPGSPEDDWAMNYRHAFHAGNHTEVFKHSVLALLIEELKKKPAPFTVVDTHAGTGEYDLSSPEAQRTGEAAAGIGRVLDAGPDIARPYLDVVRKLNPDGLKLYPGSPGLVAALMRGEDRLIACELHEEDAATLKRNYRHDKRIATHHRDGYEAIRAFIPPTPRRGLVLIDPPYERRDEFEGLAAALNAGLKKWPTGIFAAWYPVKDGWRAGGIRAAYGEDNPPTLCCEFEPGIASATTLRGSGMVIANPPWKFEETLAALCAGLARAFGGRSARHRIDWWVPER